MATSLTSTSTAAKACAGCGLVVCAGCGGGLLLSGSDKEHKHIESIPLPQAKKQQTSPAAKLFLSGSKNAQQYGEGTIGRTYGDKLLSTDEDEDVNKEWTQNVNKLNSSANPMGEFIQVKEETKTHENKLKPLKNICEKMYKAHKGTWDEKILGKETNVDARGSLVHNIWEFCAHPMYWDKIPDTWRASWGLK